MLIFHVNNRPELRLSQQPLLMKRHFLQYSFRGKNLVGLHEQLDFSANRKLEKKKHSAYRRAMSSAKAVDDVTSDYHLIRALTLKALSKIAADDILIFSKYYFFRESKTLHFM